MRPSGDPAVRLRLSRRLRRRGTVVAAAAATAGLVSAAAPAHAQEPVALCHFTGSQTNPYVLVTVPAEAVAEHRGHPRDLIPAPAAGCPATVAEPTPTPTPVPTATPPPPPPEGVAVCHATGPAGARRLVRVVVPAAEAERHRGHAQDLVPAPAGGCPAAPPGGGTPLSPAATPAPASGAAGTPGGEAPSVSVASEIRLNSQQRLPNTGSEPLVLAMVGTGFLLAGLGLRLLITSV